MPLTTTQQHFTKFYLAAFLRAPDLGGLNYWTNEVLKPGQSLQTVGGTIFSLPTVIDIYPANLSDTDFVEAIYHNVSGQNIDALMQSLWTNELAQLRDAFTAQGHAPAFAAFEARGQLVMNMLESSLTGQIDADGKAYIENRLEMAEYAVQAQLAKHEELPAPTLTEIFKRVAADDISAENAISSINAAFIANAPILLSHDVALSALRSGTFTSNFADYANSLIQQADGKLAVTGIDYKGSSSDFVLARYNTDGSLDTSFGGGDGKVTTDFASSHDNITGLIQQVDGKLVVAGYGVSTPFDLGPDSHIYHGFIVARYNTNGTLDTSFGNGGGFITIDFSGGNERAYSLTQQADGKLVVAGGSGADFALVRYNTDGTLDSGFGTNGLVTTDFAGNYDNGFSLIQQTDGKLLLAGSSNDDFALARYNADGTLDSSFGGGDGKVTTDFAGGYDSGYSLIQQTDGKLMLAGFAKEGDKTNFALARFNLDGSLDTSFGGGDGKVTTDITGHDDRGTSLIQQADGKLVVAGRGNDNFALARYTLDGTLDSSFGSGDGKVTTDFAGRSDESYSLIQQADGKLVVAGRGNNNFALARYNPDGTLDTSFGVERLSALSLSSDETATAGLYDGSNALIGSTLGLSANVAANLEVSAQASVTQTGLRLTDDAGNSSSGSAVALGTTGNDTISLSSAGDLFGFDGDDTLSGSSGADVFIGGSGNDWLKLGNDSAVDRVLFDTVGMGYMGYDMLDGMVLGTGGDVLDFTALSLGDLRLNAHVFNANPAASTDISGQVVRLLDQSDNPEYFPDIAFGGELQALTSGRYASLDMSANSSAMILVNWVKNNTTYLSRVESNDTGEIDSVELIGIINNADIDLWTAGNFAF